MSYNQYRQEKSEATQSRRVGRSVTTGHQRAFYSNPSGKGGSGIAGATLPPSATTAQSNRSVNKSNAGAQANPRFSASSGLNSESVANVASAPRSVQNGALGPPPSHHSRGHAAVAAKDNNRHGFPPSTQKVTRTDTKISSSPHTSSDAAAPLLSTKGISFQFGSFAPSLMNGMQVPARTSSAPPNLDEQKHDQASHDSHRVTPPVPIPPVPKQQISRKDMGPSVGQPKYVEMQPSPKSLEVQPSPQSVEVQAFPKARKEAQTTATPPLPTLKPSVHTSSGISMHMSIPPPQVSIQFGTPSAHIQQQGMNMPIPVHLAMGTTNALPSHKQMFVPSLQHHTVQSQGIMAQGQGMGFQPQMTSQPQLGSLGINMATPYTQQQTGNFGNTRKPVKITDPKTHEELRLEKRQDTYSDGSSSAIRSHSVLPPPQSQNMSPFNFYSSSYCPSVFYQTPTSHPITSSQINSNIQGQRFSFQSNQVSQTAPFINSSAVSLPASRTGISQFNHDSVRLEPLISYSIAPSVQVTVKPPPAPVSEKVVTSSVPISSYSSKRTETQPEKTFEEKNIGINVKGIVASSVTTGQHVKSQTYEGTAHFSLSNQPITSAQTFFNLECSVPTTVSTATKLSLPVEEAVMISTSDDGSVKDSHVINETVEEPERKVHFLSQRQVESPSILSDGCNTIVVSDNEIHEMRSEKVLITSQKIEESLPEPSKGSTLSVDLVALVTSKPETEYSCHDVKSAEICNDSLVVTVTEAIHSGKQDCLSEHTEESKFKITRDTGKGDKSPKRIEDDYECAVVSSVSQFSNDTDDATNEKSIIVNDGDAGNVIENSEGASLNDDNSVSAGYEASSLEVDSTDTGGIAGQEDLSTKSDISAQDQPLPSIPNILGECLKSEEPFIENTNSCLTSLPLTSSKDKHTRELIRSTSTSLRGKKKMREVLQKADAAGAMSDLYMAYKGPEEQKDLATTLEITGSILRSDSKDISTDVTQNSIVESKGGGGQIKHEPEDWEDAADTPKLEQPNKDRVHRRACLKDDDGYDTVMRKYSRDFLLTLEPKHLCLPDDFVYKPECDDLMASAKNSGPIRNAERPTGGSRPDRRGGGVAEEDKWGKHPGSFGFGRDTRPDSGYTGSVGGAGSRPGQGGNYGVLKNPRGQAPVGGILSGPVQSVGPQVGRMSSDSDRWMRSSGFQKGLIPPPHAPSMHKAEKKYEVGKVTDEEQGKQRQLKAILNKLTPQNFEKLFEQVKAVNIDSAATLSGVISQIFDKALMEPTFCEMYANFCSRLSVDLPDFSEDNEKITFRRLLLNKCQEEFERGEREQQEAEEEGEIKQSEGEREEKRLKARRRMLGNIRLIGELYKKRMLTERIMHECITKLLGQNQTPDEEDLESLCKLMSTIGEMIDHIKAKEHMDAYFGRMVELSNDMKFSSRVRFMLKDAIDLRKNKWHQRRKVEGPKKIEEVHRDAAQERHEASRMARGPSTSSSSRRPLEFAPRGSNMPSSNSSSIASHRGQTSHARSFPSQDVRSDDRHPYESRPLSVPLTQRPMGDESIALLPQGGLARVMSTRGQATGTINRHPVDSSSMSAESMRFAPLMNGTTLAPRSDPISKQMPGRFFNENSGSQERAVFGTKDTRPIDHDTGRPISNTPSFPATTPNNAAAMLSEDRLIQMSMYAIKEFYSAKDEKELEMCIKDLNSPAFNPTMIANWVTDSFERKEMERDLLGKLLVNLTRTRDSMLKQAQLIKGFESVLMSLEDAVNDAPKAAEYLGRLFGRVVVENVVPLGEIGRLIYEGGERPGNLREAGLAAEVLGNILEMIKAERGDSTLTQIFSGSRLRLEDFNHPDVYRSRKLLMFI